MSSWRDAAEEEVTRIHELLDIAIEHEPAPDCDIASGDGGLAHSVESDPFKGHRWYLEKIADELGLRLQEHQPGVEPGKRKEISQSYDCAACGEEWEPEYFCDICSNGAWEVNGHVCLNCCPGHAKP